MELRTLPLGPLQANCYILWKDPHRAIVIDPGDEGDRLVATLRSWNVVPELVLNTHGHFDHIGAVKHLQAAFRASYRIHDADVAIMEMVPARTRLWGVLTPEVPKPDGNVDPDQDFDVGGVRIRAIHTPGHTPGGMCYHWEGAGRVFTGDTLFLGSIGRSDFPGGDGRLLIRSIKERLLTLPPTTVVHPGHGPPSTIGGEAEENPFLV